MALSNRFQRNRAARALAARFVLLKVRTDDPKSWREWTSKYKSQGSGLPLVFVVRADGKQIYGKAGAPKALPQFLAAALKLSGKIPTRGQLIRLRKSAETAKESIDGGDIAKAAVILSRSNAEGSFAAPAVKLQKLAAGLTEKGKKALAEAQKKIKSEKTAFEGLLELVQIERHYGRLADLRKSIRLALRDARKDAGLRSLLLQANAVDRAREYEDEKNVKRALIAWKQVVEKHPDTPAAKLASERIKALEESGSGKQEPKS